MSNFPAVIITFTQLGLTSWLDLSRLRLESRNIMVIVVAAAAAASKLDRFPFSIL